MIKNPDETDTWLEETSLEAEFPTETVDVSMDKTIDVSVNTQAYCPKHKGKSYMRDGSCPLCSGLV
jgi:hypothetical protein